MWNSEFPNYSKYWEKKQEKITHSAVLKYTQF